MKKGLNLRGANLPEEVMQEAIAWHVRAKEASFDRHDELLAWLRTSQDHARALDYVAAIWDGVPEAAKGVRRQGLVSGWVLWRPWLRATVALVCCAGAALIAWSAGSADLRYESRRGEILSITLSDKTVVALAPLSRLEVHFSPLRRQVVLAAGEADINVGRSWRPFTTGLGDVLARDVGTRFVARHDDRGGAVTLVEGKVMLFDASGQKPLAELAPGIKMSWQTGSTQLVRTKANLGLESAWRDGRVVFDDTPLPEALKRMELFSSARFKIEEADLGQVKVSGIFYGKDVSPFLRALHNVYGVKAARDGASDRYVLSR